MEQLVLLERNLEVLINLKVRIKKGETGDSEKNEDDIRRLGPQRLPSEL